MAKVAPNTKLETVQKFPLLLLSSADAQELRRAAALIRKLRGKPAAEPAPKPPAEPAPGSAPPAPRTLEKAEPLKAKPRDEF